MPPTAGADVIVAQGTEGGGHVGLMGTMVLVPQVVRAVAPLPVLAAGGVADGAGLAASLMLGAEGVLLGTRFLATPEAPLPDAYKQAICASTGDDTLLTEMPDVVAGRVWPGAFARVLRNRLRAAVAGSRRRGPPASGPAQRPAPATPGRPATPTRACCSSARWRA